MANGLQHASRERPVQRKPVLHHSDEQQELLTKQPDIVGLQRLVGNQAVQRLIAQGRINQQGTSISLMRDPTIQRCGCGGACAACKEEEFSVSTDAQNTVQRWWGDDEEDSGGSWWDSAADKVSSWFGGDKSDSSGSGGTASSGGSSKDKATETDSGGSWWDDATNWVSDTWDEWFGGEETPGEPQELPDVSAECETEDTIGFGSGSGKKIKLHGLTVSNYNHGKPIPEPFPSSVKVTTGKSGKTDVFSASGTFEVEFEANPSVTLPSVPSDLKPCQEAAVREFIDGPLAAHEQDHVDAFKNNYDGTFTASVNVTNIKDTPTMRKRAMENPVNEEDQKRTATANSESKKLDPWKRTVDGMDCKD